MKFCITQFCLDICYFLPLNSTHFMQIGFISTFTTARDMSPSSATCSQSTSTPVYFCKIHVTIIFPSTPKCSMWAFSFRFLHQNPVITLLPHMYHMSRRSYAPWFDTLKISVNSKYHAEPKHEISQNFLPLKPKSTCTLSQSPSFHALTAMVTLSQH